MWELPAVVCFTIKCVYPLNIHVALLCNLCLSDFAWYINLYKPRIWYDIPLCFVWVWKPMVFDWIFTPPDFQAGRDLHTSTPGGLKERLTAGNLWLKRLQICLFVGKLFDLLALHGVLGGWKSFGFQTLRSENHSCSFQLFGYDFMVRESEKLWWNTVFFG